MIGIIQPLSVFISAAQATGTLAGDADQTRTGVVSTAVTDVLANGYFSIEVGAGLITSLRLDATGKGQYGSNTIAGTGHLGFLLNDSLLTATGATVSKQADQMTITGLPQGATVKIVLNADTMTENVTFSGSKKVRHEWDLVYLDSGFYQRTTGQNISPDQSVDMPFESFYDTTSGIFRPVEHFKKSAGTLLSLGWSRAYCRGRLANDVVFNCSHANLNFLPQDQKLTLVNEGTASSSVTANYKVLPKSYSSTLEGNKPLPEFYIRPETSINALSDPAVTHTASNLLTELFQHSVFWFGAGGPIWCEWSMRAGSFMDNPYRDSIMPTGIVIGDDGYGNYGYAYVWGTERGWPFPGGKDTRQFNTNAIFINAVWRYVMWSGNKNYLLGGQCDRTIQIGYTSGSLIQYPPKNTASDPANLATGITLGQTFKATAPFTRVATQNPTWGSTTSSFKLTLYNQPGGTVIASKVFTNCVDGAFNFLTFASQPAGQYYLEMSDSSGMIGWWSTTTDKYSGGQAYLNGYLVKSIIERCRVLMNYQQQTLLGASENLLVLGSNIGSPDHGARHATDVGSNYYDILPFGYKDAYTNADYYLSLRAMADLEEFMGNPDAARDYRHSMDLTRQKYNETFWRTNLDRDSSARYIGCVDVNGADHDFGYTFINTKAIEAGLAQGYSDRVSSVYRWLEGGESHHSDAMRNNVVQIGYSNGTSVLNADPNRGGAVANPLSTGQTLKQEFYAKTPFTSVASHNPTWNTTQSGFTLSLYQRKPRRQIATKTFTNVKDNSLNALTFSEQPAGFYILETSNPVGSIGWWSCPWVNDIYDRWVFAPRSSTLVNTTWWAYPIGTGSGTTYNPADPGFMWRWDVQLQNGGADLYESGFDIVCRARYLDPDNAWERLQVILKRYSDPDRLCSKAVGFYGEPIQGDGTAGSVGWMRSEFPETAVLGSAFFLGFFGVDPSADGLHFTPRLPKNHGITTIGAKNINYQGALFDFEATASSMKVRCTQNPQDKIFYMTHGLSGTGVFEVTVPLKDGSMILSTFVQPVDSAVKTPWCKLP